MSKSTSPSFAKIGFTVFIGVLAIVGTLVYLGGMRGHEKLVYAETYYEKSVSGLSVGSPVNFRGVKIGTVEEISFVGDHYTVGGETNLLIYVKMAFPLHKIACDTPVSLAEGLSAEDAISRVIRAGAIRATVTASGITGLSRIELDSNPAVATLPITWVPKYIYIPPATSLLDSFSDSATRVMNQINKMDIAGVWSNVSASVESCARTMENAQTISETHLADIDKILSNMTRLTESLNAVADELRANPSLLVRERIPEPLPETSRR